MIINNLKEHAAFVSGRQTGLHSANDAVDQLTEQLIAARAELQEARVEYASKMAATKAHFDSEAAAMRIFATRTLIRIGIVDPPRNPVGRPVQGGLGISSEQRLRHINGHA